MAKITAEEKALLNTKAKYWTVVMYPENMLPDWENQIADSLQYAYCYCIHDKDLTKENEEERKVHVHIILAFNNTTTYRNAFSVFENLNAEGKRAFNKIEAVKNIRYVYNYLIHDTDTAKKQEKYQYKPTDRKSGNNFDIGNYEQISQADKDKMLKEICNLIYDKNISNFADLYMYVINNLGDEYFEVVKTHSGFLERITRGLYLKLSKK